MTRRKCRTWQPNEITSIIRSSQESSSTSASPETSFCHSSQQTVTSEVSQIQESAYQQTQASTSTNEEMCKGGIACTASEDTGTDLCTISKAEEGSNTPFLPTIGTARDTSEPVAEIADQGTGLEIDNNTGDQTIKGHLASPSLDGARGSREKAEESEPCKAKDTKCVKKRPTIRLSMSQEGLAEVITKSNSASPEKPLSQPQPTASPVQYGTSRAQASSQPVPLSITASKPWPKARTHGRSRDARTWEFYCDSDAQNALTTAAEHEREGSACGALGLIRSNSAGQRPLQPSKKGNKLQLHGDASKRKDATLLEKKAPKLARTSSSFARLQNSGKAVLGDAANKGKGSKAIAIWEDPDGDSDKENWEPGTQISRPRNSRFADSNRVHAVLRENDRELSHSSSLGTLMAREKANRAGHSKPVDRVHDKENAAGDDEVARFMGESTQAQGDEDIDAVQSLLSLSQGAWG